MEVLNVNYRLHRPFYGVRITNTTAVILFNFSAFFISKILLGFGITIPLYKILAYISAKNILAKNVF